jgi:hypothetical protein
MTSSGMLRRVALTDVSEERRASIIRVTRIGELETLEVSHVVIFCSVRRLLVTATFLVHRFLPP